MQPCVPAFWIFNITEYFQRVFRFDTQIMTSVTTTAGSFRRARVRLVIVFKVSERDVYVLNFTVRLRDVLSKEASGCAEYSNTFQALDVTHMGIIKCSQCYSSPKFCLKRILKEGSSADQAWADRKSIMFVQGSLAKKPASTSD